MLVREQWLNWGPAFPFPSALLAMFKKWICRLSQVILCQVAENLKSLCVDKAFLAGRAPFHCAYLPPVWRPREKSLGE